MSAIQEQSKKLKINATNIKSVLTRKRRVLHNKRRIKARIIDVNIKQEKQALRASGSGGGSGALGCGSDGPGDCSGSVFRLTMRNEQNQKQPERETSTS